jgi:hypothetical protein
MEPRTSKMIDAAFEAMNKEYLEFKHINNPPSKRPDVCAFILLDKLFPADRDMVSAAEHDEIYLDVEWEQITLLTDEHILYLVRCGVRFNSENESLAMFT